MKSAVLNELKEMKRRMDLLYAESFEARAAEDPEPDPVEKSWEPSVDILETEGSFLLLADLPGVLEPDLQVEVAEGKLFIRGRREAVPCGGDPARFSLCERGSGSFARAFVLPADCETGSAKAELKAGVLFVEISRGRIRNGTAHKVSVQAG